MLVIVIIIIVNIIFRFQTVKCLLIVPNPESALNEEAGKLLLESHDKYSERAKMMTEIHAQVMYHFELQLIVFLDHK